MDKERRGDIVRYHLSSQEVAYLRGGDYSHIVLWNIETKDGGRIVGTDADTPIGRQNQKLIEGLIIKGGFSVKQL